ncbi:hypothetical protein C1646_717184 [Rhizophagus diaphanus]|nr:hypothetical protein C1646_717184 [Rhizophagus diaphanus] [Rhizophagus sp. MUCL 43196]
MLTFRTLCELSSNFLNSYNRFLHILYLCQQSTFNLLVISFQYFFALNSICCIKFLKIY